MGRTCNRVRDSNEEGDVCRAMVVTYKTCDSRKKAQSVSGEAKLGPNFENSRT
jgi:hypothetical protein